MRLCDGRRLSVEETRFKLLEQVCLREPGGWTPAEVEDVYWAILREPKPIVPLSQLGFENLVVELRGVVKEVDEYLKRKYA